MEFNVRNIGGKYNEMSVDEVDTGVMDDDESRMLASNLLAAASEILYNIGDRAASDACDSAMAKIGVQDE